MKIITASLDQTTTVMQLRTQCRFCMQELDPWFTFPGLYPLAGGFLNGPNEFATEELFPLSISACKPCNLFQCNEVISSDIIFKKGYFYYSSMIPFLVRHFQTYADQLALKFPAQDTTILEIGCNDGVLLRPLRQHGFKVIGVDPSHTVEKLMQDNGFNIYNDFFTPALAERIVQAHGQVDVFLSSNSFAHIDDMHSVMTALKLILKPGGCAIIEVHDATTILNTLQFDFMYHEHMTYYTRESFDIIFKKVGMQVECVESIDVHGGSLRVTVRNTAATTAIPEDSSICESSIAFAEKLVSFKHNLFRWRDMFWSVYRTFRRDKNHVRKIVGYGASGRANILLNFLQLTDIDAMVDDAASKIGSYVPVTHQEIQPPSYIQTLTVDDIILILAWPYAASIAKHIKTQGFTGIIFVPLPTPHFL